MPDLMLRDIDPERLRADIAAAVIDALRPVITEAAQPSLVDRARMADLLGISIPKLDRLVSDAVIPSKLVGTRRLFEPRSVIDALPSGLPTDEKGGETQ